MSKNKKKFNIGINNVIDKIKICRFVLTILDKLFAEINPPDETVVKARLKESKKRISAKL